MGIIICAYTYMLATIKWWLAGVMLGEYRENIMLAPLKMGSSLRGDLIICKGSVGM